ncbi:putative peroxisome biogenesis protein [Helianthus annuus]|nr:putative peroxisome biogenesis protein [Helianthus annuus]
MLQYSLYKLDKERFAVAVIFTYRALRTPNGSRRRQTKSQPPSPSTSGFNSHPNENSLPSEDLRAQSTTAGPIQPANVYSDSIKKVYFFFIFYFFSPCNIASFLLLVQLTLGQIVRQRLSDGRKVTCRLLGVILEETTPEELQIQATVKPSVLEVLIEITKYSDLYLMERVLDDESQEKVLMALENAGVFTFGGLVKDKVLFCSTENGRMSFVRQLEPDWHIDSDPEITSQLARFIRHQLHISMKTERIASNVYSSSSLEQFFMV